MSSDFTPVLLILVLGVGASLIGLYYTRDLRVPARQKIAARIKKKRRADTAR